MSCALVSAAAPVVMDAVPVAAETNEMGVFKAVLDELEAVYGRLNLFRLPTAEAGMISEANAAAVQAHGWDHLMALRDTQPTLRDEAERLIGPRKLEAPAFCTWRRPRGHRALVMQARHWSC